MSLISDAWTGLQIGLKYGPTIRKGWLAANSNPDIVAAVIAAYAALAEFHTSLGIDIVMPSPAEPAIPAQPFVDELKQHVDQASGNPDAYNAGSDNANI